MKTTPYITEEHIAAWLDGEIVGAEFDNALKHDATLAEAAEDYSALTRSFVQSRTDKRFALSSSVDARVRAALQTEISKSRKTVRMPERAPLAAPIPSSPAVRVRNVWARRSVAGLALAALLAIFWFSTRSNENVPATAINTQSIQPSQPTAPAVTAPAETPAVTAPASVPMNTAQNNNAVAPHPVSHKAIAPEQTPDLTNTSVAEAVAPVTKNPAPAPIEEADPAAVMASHRFAKMIKSTQTVVVSQQDKL